MFSSCTSILSTTVPELSYLPVFPISISNSVFFMIKRKNRSSKNNKNKTIPTNISDRFRVMLYNDDSDDWHWCWYNPPQLLLQLAILLPGIFILVLTSWRYSELLYARLLHCPYGQTQALLPPHSIFTPYAHKSTIRYMKLSNDQILTQAISISSRKNLEWPMIPNSQGCVQYTKH